MKMGMIVKRTARHVRTTPVLTEQYLRYQNSKQSRVINTYAETMYTDNLNKFKNTQSVYIKL